MSRRTRYAIKLTTWSAFSFWMPDALWHAIRGSRFNGRDAIGLTVLLPMTLLAAYILVKRSEPHEAIKKVVWPLLVGVWFLGGPFMVIGAIFSGGGFAGPEGFLRGVRMILLPLVPIFTVDMAGYDGSLGALLIASLAALYIGGWTTLTNKRMRKIA